MKQSSQKQSPREGSTQLPKMRTTVPKNWSLSYSILRVAIPTNFRLFPIKKPLHKN